MLIVIAGLVGVGKSTVTRKVSESLSIPFHSIDDDKIETGKKYPQFQNWIDNNIPFPDDFRIKVFEATLEGLRELAKVHRHAIVEETFHKKAIREPFFEEAGEIFDGIILTSVETDEKLVKERLDRRTKEGDHIVGYGMYLSFKSKFEPFEKIDYTFSNDNNFEKNLAEYLQFLREKLLL
jgi:gluconate kinase